MTEVKPLNNKCSICGGPIGFGWPVKWNELDGFRHMFSTECDKWRQYEKETAIDAPVSPTDGGDV